MLVVLLGLGGAVTTAVGIYLTKGLTEHLPIWQTVGPLLLLNAALVVPFALTTRWMIGEPEVLLLHLLSMAALVTSTACVFLLITRGEASAVATAQAISPAAALVAAPLVLGTALSAWAVPAVLLVIGGTLLPLQHAFDGMRPRSAVALMAVGGASAGVLTVFTAALMRLGVSVGETYVVRTVLASLVYIAVAPPRNIPASAVPALVTRSVFITVGFVLTIVAVKQGSPILVQAMLGTTPLVVALLELLHLGIRPSAHVVLGAAVAGLGVALLAWLG